MREIKFRAWDIRIKVMRYSNWDDGTEINNKTRLILDLDGRKGMLKAVDGMPHYWCQQIGVFQDKYPLMQYTGLEDKQGIEIYEGDIVQEQTILVGHTGKVYQQSSGEWMVSYRRGSHPLYIPDGYENSTQTHSLQDWTSDKRIVVIGNIYENPEMMGDK